MLAATQITRRERATKVATRAERKKEPAEAPALVDAGNGAEVVPLLREFGVDSIDLLVATHPDFDHIGGVDEVLAAPFFSPGSRLAS